LTFQQPEGAYHKHIPKGEAEMKFHVPDMSCGHCTATIEKGVKAADATARVASDLASKTVEITSTLDAPALQKVLADVGYPAESV